MPSRDDIWYAANATKIVHAPKKQLETFGETRIHYYIVSELMDTVNQVRVREGLIMANRPRVITPHVIAHRMVENFGEEARQYADMLIQNGEAVRILEYGLKFQKQEYNEELLNGSVEEIADNVVSNLNPDATDPAGVVIGVDDLWEISLLRFASKVINDSAPKNIKDLSGRGLLENSGGVPNAVRIELENDFRAAAGDSERVKKLGEKLKQYGVFDDYEDRFYQLVRGLR